MGRRMHWQEYDQSERYVVACYNYGQFDPVARDAFDSLEDAQQQETYWKDCGYWRVITFDCATSEDRAR